MSSEKTEEKKAPPGTVFTLIVPLDRSGEKTATFYLKEMDEETHLAAQTFIEQRKEFDATRLVIKAMSLPGSDSVDLLRNNVVAVNSARKAVFEMAKPLDAELKKN